MGDGATPRKAMADRRLSVTLTAAEWVQVDIALLAQVARDPENVPLRDARFAVHRRLSIQFAHDTHKDRPR